MTAIKFLDLDTATLQGATRRAITIGTVSDAESKRAHDPTTYVGLLRENDIFYRSSEYWHDGKQFVSTTTDKPMRDSDLIHAAQWRAVLGFEARHFGTFDMGDSFTATEVFHTCAGSYKSLAPFFHADVPEAPGQRMYMIFSRTETLNTQFPSGDMRLQDLPPSVQQRFGHLRRTGTKPEYDDFLTSYFLANGGINHGAANSVALLPRDGQHRSSPYRALHSDSPWPFNHMDIRRAPF